MRIIGVMLIITGIILFIVFVYSFIRQQNKLISPIPDDDEIKVIFITPGVD